MRTAYAYAGNADPALQLRLLQESRDGLPLLQGRRMRALRGMPQGPWHLHAEHEGDDYGEADEGPHR